MVIQLFHDVTYYESHFETTSFGSKIKGKDDVLAFLKSYHI